MNTIFTIGYEGSTIEDFVATMNMTGVNLLVDIREVPISRKSGFSKKALSATMTSIGIEYVHLRDLGDPKDGREASRRGDIASFESIYRNHLELKRPQAALKQLIELTSSVRGCLLCYERDHKHCHRSIVAEEMVKRNPIDIRHLGVRHGLASEANRDDQNQVWTHALG
ncbi:MAG: DUF488 domain-containing protein [Alphaproteobacteria bacterium]|nr:DUF488 domain-containing protein [Alphaproteobacteria bacterium]